jgi:hypothetical protein
VADRRRPAGARRVQSRAPPAGLALEAEAGVLPPLRRASRTIGCRIGSIDDQLAEPLQTAPVTGVDELVVLHERIITGNRPSGDVEWVSRESEGRFVWSDDR